MPDGALGPASTEIARNSRRSEEHGDDDAVAAKDAGAVRLNESRRAPAANAATTDDAKRGTVPASQPTARTTGAESPIKPTENGAWWKRSSPGQ